MDNARFVVRATRSGEWWAIEGAELQGAFSQARTLEEVPAMAQDAIALLLDVDPSLVEVAEVRVLEVPTRGLQDIIDHADELVARFEAMPLEGNGHREAVAALRASTLQRSDAEQAVAVAVKAARDDGLSWAGIGVILGISGEAARHRYGTKA